MNPMLSRYSHTALMIWEGNPMKSPAGGYAESTAESVLRRANTMFDLNIKHDIDRYSPDTRQAIQNHKRRVVEMVLMVESIQSLEEAEKRLKDAGQYAHAETCGWTADQLDEEQYAARQFIKSTGHDLQQQIWREDLAIDSADFKEAQA